MERRISNPPALLYINIMKDLGLRVPVALILALLLTGVFYTSCDSTSRRHVSSPKSGSRESLTARAWKLRNDGEPVDSCIAVQLQAVEELRRGESPDNAVAVLEQMGFFYYIKDDLKQALRYYREAADSLRSNPELYTSEGVIQLYGDISLLYSRVGIDDEAFRYSDSALTASRRMDGLLMSDVYKMRAGLWLEVNNVANALKCYDLADSAIDNGKTNAAKDYLHAMVNAERGYCLVENFGDNPDSVRKGARLLEEAIRGYGQQTDTVLHSFSLGTAYALMGRSEEGIERMEKSLEDARADDDKESMYFMMGGLMREYNRLGMFGKMSAMYPEYEELKDSMMSMQKTDYIVGATVRYEVQEAIRAREIAEMQLKAARDRGVWISLLSLMAVGAVLATVLTIYRRYSRLRRKREEDRSHISRLTEQHSALIERVDTLESDLRARRDSNNELLLTPQLIAGERQGAFRRAFGVLYPGFIANLKELVPELTYNDELLAMLLYLGHTTDEISVYLGISRASVNSARYRLRLKAHLDKGDDLDEFIKRVPSTPPV